MKIDLKTLAHNKALFLDDDISFKDELVKKTDIEELVNPHVSGKIYINAADEIIMEASLTGKMILHDSIDYSLIEKDFSIDIEENITDNDEYILQNDEYILEIDEILWQNIVLEVPMRIVSDESKDITIHGDGWELISEDEESQKVDPRLSPLMDLLKEEGKE